MVAPIRSDGHRLPLIHLDWNVLSLYHAQGAEEAMENAICPPARTEHHPSWWHLQQIIHEQASFQDLKRGRLSRKHGP